MIKSDMGNSLSKIPGKLFHSLGGQGVIVLSECVIKNLLPHTINEVHRNQMFVEFLIQY